MKVAEVKGIRLIMGAAKDERGSVFCNTNRWEVLWPLWRAGLCRRPCQGGFALVLAALSCAARMEGITRGAARPQSL